MPWRHRQAEHLRQRPGVAVRHLAGQTRHLGSEHLLGGDHPPQWGQPAVVVTRPETLEHEGIDVLTGETHAYPHPWPGGAGQGCGYGVVERAVQVGQRDVHHDPGDREFLRDRCGPGSAPPWGGA